MNDEIVVLDASALLALLHGEPGSDVVAKALPRGTMSAVNLSEVVAKLTERGVPPDAVRVLLGGLSIDVHPFDQDAAYAAGELREITRSAGLSFGDRACLALARRLGTAVVTADRAWASLPGGFVRVTLIR